MNQDYRQKNNYYSPSSKPQINQRKPQIQCVFQDMLSKSNGNIYISNYEAASNIKILQKNNIKAIISYAIGTLLPHTKQQIPNYLYIPSQDTPQYDIKKDFNLAYQFIQRNRKKSNILVHCVSGKSRCSALLISYLMKKYHYKCSQALDIIKRAKPNVKVNIGFLKQLNQYNFELYESQDKKILEMIQNLQTLEFGRKSPKKQQILKEKSPLKKLKIQLSNQRKNQQNTTSQISYMSPQKRKGLSLIVQKLKNDNQKIHERILQVKKTIQDHQNRKRSKSEYLRSRLEEARSKSLKKGQKTDSIKLHSSNKSQSKKKEGLYKNSPSYRIDILNKKYGMKIENLGVQKKLVF